MKLNELTIVYAHKGIASKDFSAEEVVCACINRIKEVDGEVKAFLFVNEKEAIKQAKEVDKNISAGVKPRMLDGIPVGIKDTILVEGMRCTAGSKILENYNAVYDATVARKLKNEGAIIIGKTNCDEFAMGTTGESSAFQVTVNPHDLARIPGGSSSGSAAAVAAKECFAALGSDTGGSIRQPASMCGVVGMKPTYGSVSRSGLIALASGFDVIGPLARTVEDTKIIYDAIKGADLLDSTTVEIDEYKENGDIKGLKVGIPKEYFIDGIDNETDACVKRAIKDLEKLGAEIIDISLPNTSSGLAVYYILQPAEASANLARYDGVRYGLSKIDDKEIKTLNDLYLKTRAEGFGDETKRRIMIGTYVLSAGYVDMYYKKAQAVRALIKKDFDEAFLKVDCIVTPTSPTPAWLVGEMVDDPLSMYLADIFTVSANIAGIPGISIPCGLAHDLPVGMQILAPQRKEGILFKIGVAYDKRS